MSGPNPGEPDSAADNPDTGQTDFYSRAYSAPESEQFVSAYSAADIVPYDYDSYDVSDESAEFAPPPRWPWVVGVVAIVAAVALVVSVSVLVTRTDTDNLATPETVIASGESQSGSRLSTYYNKVHPLHEVIDAFLITVSTAPVRHDTDTPVMRVLSETENRIPRTEEDAEALHDALESMDDDDPLGYAMAWYDFLTWLQETLTQALMGRPFDDIDDIDDLGDTSDDADGDSDIDSGDDADDGDTRADRRGM